MKRPSPCDLNHAIQMLEAECKQHDLSYAIRWNGNEYNIVLFNGGERYAWVNIEGNHSTLALTINGLIEASR